MPDRTPDNTGHARRLLPVRAVWAVLGTCTMLAGCAAPLQPGAPVPVQAPTATAPPAPAPEPPPPPPSPSPQPPAPALAAAAPALPEAAGAAARRLLAYHEHLRRLAPAELGAELARQNAALASAAPGDAAALTLELALVLGQTRNPADTVRALALLEPLARSTLPELQPWQALVRLLTARLAEQRRLEEQLDRQATQLRDSQRNAQQLKEKLEALRAIERSIDNRVPTPALPASGTPRAAPRP